MILIRMRGNKRVKFDDCTKFTIEGGALKCFDDNYNVLGAIAPGEWTAAAIAEELPKEDAKEEVKP